MYNLINSFFYMKTAGIAGYHPLPVSHPDTATGPFLLQVVDVNLGLGETATHGKLYIEVKVDTFVHRTRLNKAGKPDHDNATLSLPELLPDAIFRIHLKESRRYLPDPILGFESIDVFSLLQKTVNGEFWLALTCSTSKTAECSIHLSFKGPNALARLNVVADMALSSIEKYNDSGVDVNSAVNNLVRVVEETIAINAVGTGVKNENAFVGARQVVILTCEALKCQFLDDTPLSEMVELFGKSYETFEHTYEVDDEGSQDPLMQEKLKELLELIVECARFVEAYTARSFIRQMTEMDPRIQIRDYTDHFRSAILELEILRGPRPEDGNVVLTELDILEYERGILKDDWDDMPKRRLSPSVDFAAIMDFISEDQKRLNVFWISGDPGPRKSAISLTVAEICEARRYPVRCLFFGRGRNAHASVISTIAYHLASLLHPNIARRILQTATDNLDVIRGGSIFSQFDKLLATPLGDIKYAGRKPIVIILDALDECGSMRRQPRLLPILIGALAELSTQFRFLVTSSMACGATETRALQEKVRLLGFSRKPPESRHGDDICNIENNVRVTGEEEERMTLWDIASELPIYGSLTTLTPDGSGTVINAETSPPPLDDLYTNELLSSGISWNDKRSKDVFVMVMGLIVTAKEWLTIDVIEKFLDLERGTVGALLQRLKSLLSYEPVRPFHTSFADYLVSSTDKPWYIDRSHHYRVVTRRCFSIMKRMLRFNICGVETPFKLNKDINIDIPPHLDYACRFWADHLCDVSRRENGDPCEGDGTREDDGTCGDNAAGDDAPLQGDAPQEDDGPHEDDNLLCELKYFLDFRVLYWFEVLSLQKCFDSVAARSLLNASFWAKDMEISSSLWSAYRLAVAFRHPISQSAPQVYLSALSFWAAESRRVDTLYSDHPKITVDRIGTKSEKCFNVIDRYTGGITSIAAYPNKLRFAAGSLVGVTRVWDAESGVPFSGPFKGDRNEVWSISFSPDGERIASGSADGTIRVWGVDSGELVLVSFRVHGGCVTAMSFSHDGERIVSGSMDKTICISNVYDGTHLKMDGHSREVMSVAFFPITSKRVVSGSFDRAVRIWRSDTGTCDLGPLENHEGEIWSVSVSPDELFVASGSEDKTIAIWNADTGDLLSILHGHTSAVTSISFSPEGGRIASGSDDGIVRIFDTSTGQLVSGPFIGHTGRITSIAFLHFSCIVSGSSDDSIRVWDASGDTVTTEIAEHTSAVCSLLFSHGGERVVSGLIDGTVWLWDDKGRLVLGPMRGHNEPVTSVDISADDTRVVSGSRDWTSRVWCTTTGELVQGGPLRGHSDWVTSVSFSQCGRRIISGCIDETICVWGARYGYLISGPFKGRTSRVTCVAVSPDGVRVASGSVDGTVCIWRYDTGKVILRLSHGSAVWSVVFSRNGQLVVSGSGDGTIRVWDAHSGKLVMSFKDPTDSIHSMSISPDGRYVASGSNDKTIRIWNVENGNLIVRPLEGHTDPVTSICFSPDGTHVASSSSDNTIRMWNAIPQADDEEDWSVSNEGWLCHRSGNAIMWIPEDTRSTLWRPRNPALFGCQASTRLEFDVSGLLENWLHLSKKK